MKQVFDSDKMTDMEVALNLLRLMDDPYYGLNKDQRTSNIKSTIIGMAENAIGTLTNPFAKNLLMAKLAEQGQY